VLWVVVMMVMGSQYDPHVANSNPWFEGWYTRVSTPQDGSFGLIVGSFVQPNDMEHSCYAAILSETGGVLKEYKAYPKSITVTKQGAPVTKQPDRVSPPVFELFSSEGEFSMNVTQKSIAVSAKMDVDGKASTLEFDISGPHEEWGRDGEGPEGWAGRLPFIGLHWYVFSLKSNAKYKFVDVDGSIRQGTGVAHMEKNWGTNFPSAWIWAEGVDHTSGFKFALAGGIAVIAGLPVPNAYLIGYRSKQLKMNFRPQDPALFRPKIDSCNGVFEIIASNFNQYVEIKITAPNSTFSYVNGPTMRGFVPESVESFSAEAVLSAYEFGIFGKGELIESYKLTNVALEFGGDYLCERRQIE